MVIEVKGGKNVNISSLRALRGVLNGDTALMAGLIIMEPLGTVKQRNFHKFCAQAGDLTVSNAAYPRLQMLTITEIFEGKRFDTPGVVGRSLKQPLLRI